MTRSHDGLPRSQPSDQDVDAAVILAFLDAASAAAIELHSFMLYRQGHVVAEGWSWPYRADRRHMMFSLAKSVVGCGVGLAVAEGHFGLDDKVVSFFKEELPRNVDEKLASMRVRDLLTMQTGHAEGVSGAVWRQISTSWVAEFFKVPVVHQPGTTFVYDSSASFMLSAILTRTTGLTLRDYLQPRLFQPLGIENLEWDSAPGGMTTGGSGLAWSTADALKLGVLYLQNGQWQGRQIVPADWIRASARPQASNGRYGYHWWLGPDRAYFAAGSFGQFSIVFPEHDAVLAITAAVAENFQLLPVVWKHFPAAFNEPSASASADTALRDRCANLRLLPALSETRSTLDRTISGRTFEIQTNEDEVSTIRFDFSAGRCLFSLHDDRGEHRIAVGLRDWIEGDTSMTGNKLHHQYQSNSLRVVAGGRWIDDRTFEMTWQFVETAFRDRVVCRFDGDTVTVDRSVNVNSAARSRPTLRGMMSRSPP